VRSAVTAAKSAGPQKAPRSPCSHCGASHFLTRCDKFKALSVPDRVAFLKEKKICFLCLRPNHTASSCTSDYRCSLCNKRHSAFIHSEHSSGNNAIRSPPVPAPQPPAPLPAAPPPQQPLVSSHGDSNARSASCSSLNTPALSENCVAFVPVVKVVINESLCVSAALDTCSTNSFCTRALADRLRLPEETCTLHLGTLSPVTLWLILRSFPFMFLLLSLLVTVLFSPLFVSLTTFLSFVAICLSLSMRICVVLISLRT